MAYTDLTQFDTSPKKPVTTDLWSAVKNNILFLFNLLTSHKHTGADGSSVIEVGGNLLRNGSFEDETIGAITQANNWTLTAYAGGSFACSDVDAHGDQSLAIVCTVLANGGGDGVSDELMPCGALESYRWQAFVWGNLPTMSAKVEMLWFLADKITSAGSTVLWSSNALPTAKTLQGGSVIVPATARFMQIKFTGGIPGSVAPVTAGTAYFDGGKIFSVDKKPTVQTFTASAPYTKPPGLRYAIVKLVAGGGGSGSVSPSQWYSGSGGGSSEKRIDASDIAATEVVTVGVGGTGYGAGTASSFGAHCSATGGRYGNFGGVGVGGDINIQGGRWTATVNGAACYGGETMFSTGACCNATPSGYGTGGGQSITGFYSGANGIVIVEEHY